MADPKVLEKINGYSVVRKISEGTSGTVYLTELDGKNFAIKVLKQVDEDALVRFRRESSTLARLQHENLVKIYDIGEHNGVPFLIMEYLDGQSIDGEIAKNGTLPQDESIELIKSVSLALSELHKNNLLHRDIKPVNIFKLKNGKFKLIDLGLAGDVNQIKTETSLTGTPMYCSPEQSRILKRDVDFRSDLYSLGATLFSVLTGRAPFIGTLSEILQQNASRVAPDIRELNSEVRPAIALIITKLLSKDPDDRYQSVSGLMYDLNRLDQIDKLIKDNQNPLLGKNDHVTVTSKVSFIERVNETKKIQSVWDEVLSGNSRLLLVSGPSGSGKSRLTSEFIKKNRSDRFLVLQGKCQLLDRDYPLCPIRQAFDTLFEEISFMQEAEKANIIEKIRNAGTGLERSLRKLNKAFSEIFSKTESEEVENVTNFDEDGEIYFIQIADFLANLSTQWEALVLHIDDLQWLDQASLQIFKNIFDRDTTKKILVLGTARDDEDSKQSILTLEEKFSEFVVHNINVEVFTKKQVSDLICGYLGAQQVASYIVDVLQRLTSGNPFVLIEYLHAGMDQGFLNFKAGDWILNQEVLEKIALSESVYELILKKVASSSKENIEFLQFAAVIGNVFRAHDLGAILNFDSAKVDIRLAEGESLGLVERVNAVKWKFVHDKISESLISSLVPERMKEVNDKLAAHFFNKVEKSPDEFFLVARFYANGNVDQNQKNAISTQITAGIFAFENFSYSEAFVFFRRAKDFIKSYNIENARLIEIAPKLAVCAAMCDDEVLARVAVGIHIINAKTDIERAHAHALNAWILNQQSDVVGSIENFKRAMECIHQPYPKYLHIKILQLAIFWFLSLLLDVLPLRISKKRYFGSDQVDFQIISNMYRTTIMSYEGIASLVDTALVSLRFLILNQLVGGAKDKAIGYASICTLYGSFKLEKIAMAYSDKAAELSTSTSDKFVGAFCEYKRIFARFHCGEANELSHEFLSRKEYFHKYLSPVEFARFGGSACFSLGYRGFHLGAISLANDIISAYKKKNIRFTMVQYLGLLGQLNMQLVLIGRAKEAQKVKAIFLKIANVFRHTPMASRTVINFEGFVMVASEELGTSTDETMGAWWGRRNSGMEPLANGRLFQAAFVLLNKFEFAQGEEKFSARLELSELLQSFSLKLYSPLFKSDYYFVLGGFNRVLRNFDVAKACYNVAEHLASQTSNLICLFNIQRDRARIHLIKGELDLMDLSLSSALNLTLKHNWNLRKGLLLNEFGEFMESFPGFTGVAGSSAEISAHTHQGSGVASRTFQGSSAASRTFQGSGVASRTFQGSSAASRTFQGPSVAEKPNLANANMSSVAEAVHPSVSESTVMNGGSLQEGVGLEEVRFIDAILNVSNAFVVSVEPIEQSKAVLSVLTKLFAAERGVLFELRDGATELSLVAGNNAEGFELETAKVNSVSRTIVNKVFQEKRPIVVAGTDEAEALGSESAVLHNIRSMMSAPLMLRGKLLGVVYLDSSLTRGLFTSSDIGLFSTLANHISVSLELSRMKQVELDKANLKRELDIQSAIATESKKVKILVDSMQQALFSVTVDGTIVEPVSKFTKRVLGKDVVGQNFIDVLYKDLSHEGEKIAGIQSAMESVFGEDDLQWELMEGNFPPKVGFLAPALSAEQDNKRILKINPSPVWDDHSNLEKILFVVEDITSLEALENQVKTHKAQSLMLEEILQSDSKDLREFFDGATNSVKAWMFVGEKIENTHLAKVLRDMHSLKGVARLYKVGRLSEQIHNSETVLVPFNSPQADLSNTAELVTTEIRKIEIVLNQYIELFAKIFGTKNSGADYSAINELALVQLEKRISDLARFLEPKDLASLKLATLRLKYRPLSVAIRKFDKMVVDISQQLNKKVQFEVDGEAFADLERLNSISECVVHLIRNSVDHGLEEPNERAKSGKSETGSIRINCVEDDNAISIFISDDGRGINADKISDIAVKKGIISIEQAKSLSQKEKLELIYASNFSTKAEATDVSGRGIGMDVVKRNVEKMGGELSLHTEVGKGTKFSIVLKQSA